MSEGCDRFVKQVDAYIMSFIDENSPVLSNVLIENAGEDPKLSKKVEVSQVPSKMKNEEIENFLVTKKAPMNSFIKKGGELLKLATQHTLRECVLDSLCGGLELNDGWV